MTPDKYKPSAVVGKVVKIIFLLSGHVVEGLAPGEIAHALKISRSNATVLLAQLYHEGMVEMVEVGSSERWRVTPKIGQISLGVLNEIERRDARLNEIKNRFTREV